METFIHEYNNKKAEKQKHLDNIKNIIVNSNASLEGNCFYHHATLNEFPELYSKQVNLFWCGKQAQTHICEIGFNAGHSAMIMLLGRNHNPIHFTVFDIGHHPYTAPCGAYIASSFPHAHFEYIKGDSTVTMPQWINNKRHLVGKYDVVHVDGGHSEHCITNDMKNADIITKIHGIVIVDDTNLPHINNCVNRYIANGKYIELKLLPSHGYPHRILRKLR